MFLKSSQFLSIKNIASQRNIQCYLVGGYVRDSFLGKDAKDIDIVCVGEGNSEILAREYAETNGYKLDEAGKYGALKVGGPYELDFIMARSESYRRDSRQPIVKAGSLSDDLLRRDFTVNAIAVDVQNLNNVIDPFGGIDDIKAKIIRTVNDPAVTFDDDPLRIMRAYRFASQLNFTIEVMTYREMLDKFHRLDIISMERISTEFVKLLKGNTNGIDRMFGDGCFFKKYIPELYALDFGGGHKNNYNHTQGVYGYCVKANPNYLFRLVGLLHDIGKAISFKKIDGEATFHMHELNGSRLIRGIFERLKLPLGEELDYVTKMVAEHGRIAALCTHYDDITDSALRRFVVECDDILDDLFLFTKCDITTADDGKRQRIHAKVDKLKARVLEFKEREQLANFRLALNGFHIMETFGVKGKQVGEYKNKVFEAVMEGVIPNTVEAGIQFLKGE